MMALATENAVASAAHLVAALATPADTASSDDDTGAPAAKRARRHDDADTAASDLVLLSRTPAQAASVLVALAHSAGMAKLKASPAFQQLDDAWQCVDGLPLAPAAVLSLADAAAGVVHAIGTDRGALWVLASAVDGVDDNASAAETAARALLAPGVETLALAALALPLPALWRAGVAVVAEDSARAEWLAALMAVHKADAPLRPAAHVPILLRAVLQYPTCVRAVQAQVPQVRGGLAAAWLQADATAGCTVAATATTAVLLAAADHDGLALLADLIPLASAPTTGELGESRAAAALDAYLSAALDAGAGVRTDSAWRDTSGGASAAAAAAVSATALGRGLWGAAAPRADASTAAAAVTGTAQGLALVLTLAAQDRAPAPVAAAAAAAVRAMVPGDGGTCRANAAASLLLALGHALRRVGADAAAIALLHAAVDVADLTVLPPLLAEYASGDLDTVHAIHVAERVAKLIASQPKISTELVAAAVATVDACRAGLSAEPSGWIVGKGGVKRIGKDCARMLNQTWLFLTVALPFNYVLCSSANLAALSAIGQALHTVYLSARALQRSDFAEVGTKRQDRDCSAFGFGRFKSFARIAPDLNLSCRRLFMPWA